MLRETPWSESPRERRGAEKASELGAAQERRRWEPEWEPEWEGKDDGHV